MKNFALIFFISLDMFLLNACTPQALETPVSTTLEISPTLTKLSKVTVTPTMTATITPTVEPEVVLAKIKEWDGSMPVAWSKDGKYLASISDDKLELENFALETLWRQDLSPVVVGGNSAVTFSADDKFVVVYDAGLGTHLFDINNGKQLASSKDDNCLNGADLMHFDSYPRNMFTNSNILYVGFDGNNKIVERRPIQVSAWTVQPLHCKGKVITIPVPESGPSSITTMNLSPSSDYLVLVSTHYYSDVYEGWIKVWDTKNYNQLCEIPGTYAVFRPSNGLLAVTNTTDDKISYWDVTKCELVESINIPAYKLEQAMVFTPDGKYIIIQRTSLQVFDADTGELVFDTLTKIISCGDLAISPNGKYLFAEYCENGGPVTALWQVQRK